MSKTITIRDDLYEKLRALKGDASLNDFLEHLLGEGKEERKNIELLKNLRKTLELRSAEKDIILKEIYAKRGEKRAFDDRPG
ncbi:MAG: antitoxin VapB family protein [Candidatus Methanospirareceae archaeon]